MATPSTDLPATLPPEALGLVWGAPFAAILLAIALMPNVAPKIWHHHMGKIALAISALFLLTSAFIFGSVSTWHLFVHAMLHEYVPFVVLVTALYIAAGGLRITGTLSGRPVENVTLLAVGTGLASLIGTTGAAMLLIRPLIRANEWRQRPIHIYVFFIILVANVGGALSPIGDPPLFMGFLRGVPFEWPLLHLGAKMGLLSLYLMALFYLIDRYAYAREPHRPSIDADRREPLGAEGWINAPILVGMVGAVLLSGLWRSGIEVPLLGDRVKLEDMVRTALLILLAGLSWKLTRRTIRQANQFNWHPVAEVACLFFAIFVTLAPVTLMLARGIEGPFAPILQLIDQGEGRGPSASILFWVTGALSAFLDNAPTYLVMLQLVGGDIARLTGPDNLLLVAISAGAVFLGAMTYVGNAPNFMVRAIVEQRGIRMPSFFAYIGWTLLCLVPGLILVDLLFLARW